MTEEYTYPKCAEKIFGKPGKIILLSIVSVYLLGTLVSYIIVIGDIMEKVAN